MRSASVLELDSNQAAAALDEGFADAGDLGEIADSRCHREIERHLRQLACDEEQARLFEDWERLEQVQNQKDHYLDYLRKARNKDGQARKAGSRLDANRQSVWQSVHRAYRLIQEEDPDLAGFLKRSLVTKSVCRYDPTEPTDWRL